MAPVSTDQRGQLDVGTARRMDLAVSSTRIAALQVGQPSAPSVLLLPGYTGSKEDFAPILGAVAASGFLVTAIDLPGQYESPGLPDPSDYSPDALAPIVLELAGLLGGQVHLLGHSYGGLVARAAVIADVADGRQRIRSLVLMDSGPSAVQGERREMIEYLAPVLESGGMARVYAAMQAAAAAAPGFIPAPPALAEFLRRRFVASSPVMLRGMGDAIQIEPDRVHELAAALVEAALQTLVIFGVDDYIWAPVVQADMADRLAAEQRVVPGAAHSPAVENPGPTAHALTEFWHRAG
jgi:pimeloyl-ACP methyl ester carboxylesterase